MSKLHILPIFSVTLMAIAMAAGCSRPKEEATHQNLPDEVKVVAKSIMADSPTVFAASVVYPLERPYPLHAIKDSAEMVNYYPTLVDDSLKNVVSESPDTLWQQIGWRGWTLADGSYLWVDEGKVYQVDYISRRETFMLDSLMKEEMSTLSPTLRGGWKPVLCIVDTIEGRIFRIDSEESENPLHYRLLGYSTDSDLSGEPAIVLYGNLDYEGSMANRLYHFEDSIGTTADFSPDLVSDEDTIPEIEVVKAGKTKRYKAKPSYWLEHVGKRGMKKHI